MARLVRVERDSTEFERTLAQVATVLVDLNDRVDRISDRVDRLGIELGGRIDRLSDELGSRLDRLIAVTVQERTYSFERLGDIERRLSRLEKHAGF